MNSDSIVIAQLGVGYWGPNLLRNFSALPGCHVKYAVDFSAERRSFAQANFPRTTAIDNAKQVFADPEVHAVIIATAAGIYFSLAAQALKAGKYIFVEKPLGTRAIEVDDLAAEATRKKLTGMVGYTFSYNTAVRYVKKMIE